MAGRVSKERIITGALLILLCAAAIILGGWFAAICAYVGLLATAFDALRAFKAAGYKVLWPVVLITAVLMLPAYMLLDLTGVCILLAVSVVLTLCAAVFVRKSDFLDVMLTLFLLMYPGAARFHAAFYSMRAQSGYDADFSGYDADSAQCVRQHCLFHGN